MYKGRIDYPYQNIYQSQRKKNKAADCIFLDEKRECHCKDNQYDYLSRCSHASTCKYRIKSTEQPIPVKANPVVPDNKEIEPIEPCPFAIGEHVLIKTYKINEQNKHGAIFDIQGNILLIQIENKIKKYQWPTCSKVISKMQ